MAICYFDDLRKQCKRVTDENPNSNMRPEELVYRCSSLVIMKLETLQANRLWKMCTTKEKHDTMQLGAWEKTKWVLLAVWVFVTIADTTSTAFIGGELNPAWSWAPLWITLTVITLLCAAWGVAYWRAVGKYPMVVSCSMIILILAKAMAIGWNLNTIVWMYLLN